MSASIPNRIHNTPSQLDLDITALVADFPYDYGRWLRTAANNRTPLIEIPAQNIGKQIAIIGSGAAGMIAAYECMRAGFEPIIFEASGRIGGRMHAEEKSTGGFAELGCMRFPLSCKPVFHYFDKVGAAYAPFPNPGTSAAPGTVVDYKGTQQYYDVNNSNYPIPTEYKELEAKWDLLLAGNPIRMEEMTALLASVATATNAELANIQQQIKDIWNNLVGASTVSESDSWDNLSFHQALINNGWSFDDIELFGQVGFGSGGWNTDFVNCFLEILRVEYTYMDSDHQLIYNGTTFLPQSLWDKSPNDLGDAVNAGVDGSQSLSDINNKFWTAQGIPSNDMLFNEVQAITSVATEPNQAFQLVYLNTADATQTLRGFQFLDVIYTPHVRTLQMMRAKNVEANYQSMQGLFSEDLWEAIEYTHYMGSSKTFIQVSSDFWNNINSDGTHPFSVTLSDRLTRGTYVFAYDNEVNDPYGYGICTSYTWNDDSLKFVPFDVSERVTQTLNVLQDIYPRVNFTGVSVGTPTGITWESETYYIGAFKNNLPGQYRYQRALFTQFMDDSTRLVLAGDDISFTAGWLEGAITTALNAVNKIAVQNGGYTNGYSGPVDQFDALQPIER